MVDIYKYDEDNYVKKSKDKTCDKEMFKIVVYVKSNTYLYSRHIIYSVCITSPEIEEY